MASIGRRYPLADVAKRKKVPALVEKPASGGKPGSMSQQQKSNFIAGLLRIASKSAGTVSFKATTRTGEVFSGRIKARRGPKK